MKKCGFVLLLILVIVVLGTCVQKEDVSLVPEESSYSDYYVKNGNVYINCILTVDSKNDCKISFEGKFEEEVEIGLLTETKIKTAPFDIKKGKQSIDVTFVGDFGGTNKKTNRNLPDITIIQENLYEKSFAYNLHNYDAFRLQGTKPCEYL